MLIFNIFMLETNIFCEKITYFCEIFSTSAKRALFCATFQRSIKYTGARISCKIGAFLCIVRDFSAYNARARAYAFAVSAYQ